MLQTYEQVSLLYSTFPKIILAELCVSAYAAPSFLSTSMMPSFWCLILPAHINHSVTYNERLKSLNFQAIVSSLRPEIIPIQPLTPWLPIAS